jgi:serine/threonine protein kinase
MPYVDLPLPAILSQPYFSAHPFPSYLESPPQNPFLDQPPNIHAIITRSILFQVLHALAYLHGQNPPIAHRDINPGNILLTRNGTVKLVDFGIGWDQGLRTFTISGEDYQDDIYNWKEDPEDMCGQVATG